MPYRRGQRSREQSNQPICIVDDDETVAHSLEVLLEACGFDAWSYNSGAEFLADERRRMARCLLIDQHMPGMNGLDVVDHLQKEGIRVRTILISAQLNANIKERASILGITRVVEEPFAADGLIGLIRAALLERD
jgi:two-component system, LuxR family, response regulator FixJ